MARLNFKPNLIAESLDHRDSLEAVRQKVKRLSKEQTMNRRRWTQNQKKQLNRRRFAMDCASGQC